MDTELCINFKIFKIYGSKMFNIIKKNIITCTENFKFNLFIKNNEFNTPQIYNKKQENNGFLHTEHGPGLIFNNIKEIK